MSYSSVLNPVDPLCNMGSDTSLNTGIETRLAYSDDQGGAWTDAGPINPTVDFCTGHPGPLNAATFVNETSSLVVDPYAPASQRWKLFWVEYLAINDGVYSTATRHFDISWIGERTAPDPSGPWSAPSKAFVGWGYNAAQADSYLGPPQTHLDALDPALSDCYVFVEPGVIATSSGLYMALTCHTVPDTNERIILLQLTGGTTQYRGILLRNTDAVAYSRSGYEAGDLFQDGGRTFLLATLIRPDYSYESCLAFEVADLNSAALRRDSGGYPVPFFKVDVSTSLHNGACTFDPHAAQAGVIQGVFDMSHSPDWFRLYRTFARPVPLTSSLRTASFGTPYGTTSVMIPSGALASDQAVVSGFLPQTLPAADGTFGLTPTGVAFSVTPEYPLLPAQSAHLSMGFRSSDVAGLDRSRLVVARYDPTSGIWSPLVSTVDSANGLVAARVDHFSLFQIMLASASSNLGSVRIFPNPLRPSLGQTAVTFANLPQGARVRIYTLTGELLRDLSADSAGLASWDGANSSGRKVASGVYPVFVQGGGKSMTFKVAVQR